MRAFLARHSGFSIVPPEETAAFYAAYRAFAEILYRPELMVTFRLAPGVVEAWVVAIRARSSSTGGR